jgi:serine/threonine-protein kinase RsbW/stage II sporulation protein AB (anti-sigma F factor)
LPLAVAGGGAAVASGVAAVLGRSRSILSGRFPCGTSHLGLIRLERVADRGADVPLPGRSVAALGRAVAGVGVLLGLVAIIGGCHRETVATGGPAIRWTGSALGSCRTAHGQKGATGSASWTAPASAESVARLREAVADFAFEGGVREPWLSDIRLAVSEAVTNAVMHAFRRRADGTVIASVTMRDPEWLEVRVTDNGSGMAPRNDSPGIGLGLSLIRHLTDQFEHRRPPGSTGTELSVDALPACPVGRARSNPAAVRRRPAVSGHPPVPSSVRRVPDRRAGRRLPG